MTLSKLINIDENKLNSNKKYLKQKISKQQPKKKKSFSTRKQAQNNFCLISNSSWK